MNDMEKELIGMSLDIICKKLYEKVKPVATCDPDAWCDYEVSNKIDLLEKMIDAVWVMEVNMEYMANENKGLEYKQQHIISENSERIENLEKEREQYRQSLAVAKKRIKELEGLVEESNTKLALQEYYNTPKTKKGNQNARRKDIDGKEVYRLVKGGMSITKVAEKYHASRSTIRKYFTAGENICTHGDYDDYDE
ncbi:MAG: helix-turn-helix domain-containing protein [bacterium]|nr:helix-turn-helix domain-containing protein [bacterium]MCM1375330.1 helix-turn-helix domain-containing protein [Muribaculum sp.]